ncbi:hypothetical protein PSEUDO8BK_40691 [Pseudomonas sp. 8BK]|nr:hypothetical protein PSEUDO8BK_40691 [Pseudomonas sp. 8BK]
MYGLVNLLKVLKRIQESTQLVLNYYLDQ